MDNKTYLAYKRDLKGVGTPGLYMRSGKGKTMADLDSDKLRRGMCQKSGGRLEACHGCGAPCTAGRLLMEREAEGEVMADMCKIVMPEAPKPEPTKAEKPKRARIERQVVKRGLTGFAPRLKEAFGRSGMTQVELARELGSKQGNVARWLNGAHTPSLPIMADMCKVLNVSADWLLGLEVDG